MLVGFVDHHPDVVSKELRQELVDPGDRVLREERLPELPLDRRDGRLGVAAGVVVLVELLAMELELQVLLPPESTPPRLRRGVRLERDERVEAELRRPFQVVAREIRLVGDPFSEVDPTLLTCSP